MKTKIDIMDYEQNEFGLAELFIRMHGNNIKYVSDIKEFYLWNKDRGLWEKDNIQELNRRVEKFLSFDLYNLANEISDIDERDNYLTYLEKQQRNNVIRNIIVGAMRNPEIQLSENDFDSQPRYFNCRNKVYDIQTRKSLSQKREFQISKQSNVVIDKSVKNDTWRNFLLGVMGNDESMYTYILRMIGYIMMGNPKDDCIFFLHGERTRNGKSTFASGLLKFFGDYAITVQPQTISKGANRTAGGPNPDIVRIQGKRFVNIAEASNNQKLDSAIIKVLTGGDVITARPLYKDYKEFTNSSVFVFHTNHLPTIDDATIFRSNRIIVIPFEVEFKGEMIDTEMDKKLSQPQALSGLFLEVRKTMIKYNGKNIKSFLPMKIKNAIKQYKYESDPIQCFIDENFIEKERSWTETKIIYSKYYAWARKNHIPEKMKEIAPKILTTKIEEAGYCKVRRNTGNGFKGIVLK